MRTTAVLAACATVLAACVPSGGGAESAPPAPVSTSAAATTQATVAPTSTVALGQGETDPPTTTTTIPAVDPVAALLDSLSLRDKVAQMVMVDFQGTSATDPAQADRAANLARAGSATPEHLIRSGRFGGVILFGPNTPTVESTAQLIADLQAAAGDGPGIGLLVAVDQEGGRVRRIPAPVLQLPSAVAFGAGGDADLTRQAARAAGVDLAAIGVNHILAPVADVATVAGGVVADRSYGADPALVSAMVGAAVEGFESAGLLATAKHFPGHGGTAIDSHVSLPTLGVDLGGWHESDAPPFAAAIAAGVDVVMLGHIAIPAIDPSGRPATVSAPIIDHLRDDMGFDGIVMSDALVMGAVADVPDLAVEAVAAGVDLLLMPADAGGTVDAVVDAVLAGRIPEARIDAAVERILDAKLRVAVLVPPPPADPALLGAADPALVARLEALTGG